MDMCAEFPIDAEVEVFTHKKKKKNDVQSKKLCVDVTHSAVHLFFCAVRSIGGQY